MIRNCTIALLFACAVAGGSPPAWAQGTGAPAAALQPAVPPAETAQPGLEALLQSFGFELKQEGGHRVVEVTLQQVLKLALERNLTLKSVRMGESVALSSLEAARQRLNPTLKNDAGYTRSQAASFSGLDSNFLVSGGSDAYTLSSKYSKPTESGLEYSLTYTERRLRPLSNAIPSAGADPSGLSTGDWVESSALTGALTIPFGQDAGREFNAIPVRRGEAGVTGSRLTIRQRELDLVGATASVYWDLVAALENVRVQEDAVKLSEQLLEDNRQRLEAGVLSPFDVQVTEAQLAREREGLITARATVLRVEDLARALLNLQVIDFEVRPLDRPQVHDLQLDYPSQLERVYANSPELQRLENQFLTNSLDLAEAQNAERTNLDLALFYTLQGYNTSPLGGVGGFAQTDLDSYGATLTWTVPLFDVGTQERIRQRTLERQQLEILRESGKSDLTVRLQSALRQLRVAREQVDTAGVARRLAEEQLKNEIERFRVGESTSFQVAQSQQNAGQVQVQEILARLNFERNYLDLLLLTGDIFDKYGLEPTSP